VITRIAIDPAPLADLQVVGDEQATGALHKVLITALNAHGAVFLGSKADTAELLKEIKAQSQEVRKHWEVVIVSLSKSRRLVHRNPPCTKPMAQIDRLEELRDEWRDQVEVVVVEKAHADDFGVGGWPGHVADADSSLEISTARAAWETAAMEDARRLAERANHPSGTRREDFWSDVLAPLARLSSEVVVLDRYLFQRLLEKNARGGSGTDEQVCWLLEQLDIHMPPGSVVTLIAHDLAPQSRPPVNAQDIAALIERYWLHRATGHLKLVNVVVAPWRQRRQSLPHDRHIRFNVGAAVTFPQGLGPLATPTIQDPDGLNWHYRQGSRAVEPVLAAEERVLDYRNHGVTRALMLESRGGAG
jgi:hypothetical protein